MPRNIELPDGRTLTLTGNETPEQISLLKQKLSSQYQPEQPAPPSDDFFARTSEVLAGRGRKMAESVERGEVGLGGIEAQGIPETAFQVGGQAALGAGDVLGNLAISGYRALPDIPYGLGELGAAIGGTGAAQAAGGALGGLMEQYGEFAEERPRAAANIEAALGLGTAFVPVKGLGGLEKIGRVTGKALEATGKSIKNIIPKAKDVTADVLRKEASNAYALSDELGGTIKPEIMTNLADDISKKISQEGATLPKGTQKALRGVADPENVIRQANEVFETLRGEPLTLEGFRAIDQTLGDLAYKTSTPDDVSRKVLIMQKSLRDAVENAKPSDLIGVEGFEAYKAGKELWSKQSRIRDLENITKRAFATEQPTQSLKRALKRFLAKDENLRGFSKAELDLIKKTADTGIAGEMLRGISGRLAGRVALGTGDIALAPALIGASAGARTFSDDMILKQMQNINQLISRGDIPQTTIPQNILGGIGGALEATGGAVSPVFKGGRGRLGTIGAAQELNRQQ